MLKKNFLSSVGISEGELVLTSTKIRMYYLKDTNFSMKS